MIDIKMIKKSMLSAAYQGKLSRTADYTVKGLDELHASIKKYQDVTDSEKLIETPSHWKWSRLGYISNNHGQKTPSDTFSYIDVGTLDNVHQRLAKEENIILANDAPSRARKIVEYGDVLYSTVRPYLHNICIIDKTFSKEPIASTAFCVMSVKPEVIINKFLFYWLLTPEFDKYANGDPSKGTLYPAIGEKDLLAGVIPIPPLEEQAEIVEKVDEAFNALSNLEAAQSAYSSNLEALKSKIIDAGIQGKLTEQLPEDGNAEDLYAAIQEEKARLSKEKKIKKSKTLPEITEEEIPFEIPDNWKWVRLVDLCKQVTDGAHKTPHYTEKGIPFLSVKDISSGFMDFSDTKFISTEEHEQLVKRCKPEKSDILFCRIGTLGKAIEIDTDIQFSIFVSLGLIKPIETRITRYLVYVLNSGYGYEWIKQHKAGDSMHAAKINLDMLRTFPVPIPPIKEMKRIVDKVNMLLDMI